MGSSSSVDCDDVHRHGNQQGGLEERPRPLGEDGSPSLAVPRESLALPPGSISSGTSVVNRVFKVAFLGMPPFTLVSSFNFCLD